MAKKTPTKFNYLVNYIISGIVRGDYLHKSFPSERMLIDETGLSLTTVRRAIIHCVEKGYLIRDAKSRQPRVNPRYLEEAYEKHVALILPGFPYQNMEWATAIEAVCEKHNYSLNRVAYQDEGDPVLIKHLNGPYDLIFFSPPVKPSSFLISQIRKNAERVVTLFQDYTRFDVATICDPPLGFVRTSLEHLVEKGCRSIDCVNVMDLPHKMFSNEIAEWRQFLKEKKCSGNLVSGSADPHVPQYEEVRPLVRDYLKSAGRFPDAFICTTGQTATGVVRALADCGLRTGLDVKVLALSSAKALQYTTPSITCMQPRSKEELVEVAFQVPRPLRMEFDTVDLFVGESTELFEFQHVK